MKLLFSAVGTSDPARGCYDGPILHIIRYYRPDIIYLLVTPQMRELDNKDGRFRVVEEHIRKWEGYQPEIVIRNIEVEDPSDMDEVYLSLKREYETVLEQYGDYEFLFNLSSATPQMKFVLSLLALDRRTNATPIQVKNREKAAGTAKRTDAADYNVREEIKLAEINEIKPDAEYRCTEEKMSALKRELEREEIVTLLKRRDYAALSYKKLPKEAKLLTEHLNYRNNLLKQEARQKAQQLNQFPIELYPMKKEKDFPYRNGVRYEDVIEYFLMMKNMQIGNRYSDFLLRLNPFSLVLHEKAIDCGMRKKYRKSVTDLWKLEGNRTWIDAPKVAKDYPELKTYYEKTVSEERSRRVTFSIKEKSPHNYHILVGFFEEEVGTEVTETLRLCYKLYEKRNTVAHELASVSDKDIYDAVNISCAELVKRLETVIAKLYPCCDAAVFDVYERCNTYIMDKLL